MQSINALTLRERELQDAVHCIKCPIAKAHLVKELSQVRRDIKAKYQALFKRR